MTCHVSADSQRASRFPTRSIAPRSRCRATSPKVSNAAAGPSFIDFSPSPKDRAGKCARISTSHAASAISMKKPHGRRSPKQKKSAASSAASERRWPDSATTRKNSEALLPLTFSLSPPSHVLREFENRATSDKSKQNALDPHRPRGDDRRGGGDCGRFDRAGVSAQDLGGSGADRGRVHRGLSAGGPAEAVRDAGADDR